MKKITFVAIVAVLIFIIINLVGSIYTLWHKQDLLTNAKEQLVQEKQENINLKKELAKVKSPQFLDEEARNKLLLVKPGESEVIIDQSLLSQNKSKKKSTPKPNWQQWMELLFN